MTEPGGHRLRPPPPLAALTATPRDRLGLRRRGRRRPGRLRSPERASAPPHNRAAPRGASRHARARGRRAPHCPAPAAAAPPLMNIQMRAGDALALSGGPGWGGERGRERERRVSSGYPRVREKERPVGPAWGWRRLSAWRALTRASTRACARLERFLGNRPSWRGVPAESAAGRARHLPSDLVSLRAPPGVTGAPGCRDRGPP